MKTKEKAIIEGLSDIVDKVVQGKKLSTKDIKKALKLLVESGRYTEIKTALSK